MTEPLPVPIIPKWIRNHPVVGFGMMAGDPHACKGGFTRGEAFLWLAMNERVTWAACDNGRMYLTMKPGAAMFLDAIPRTWGWRDRHVKAFTSAMLSAGIIDDSVSDAVLSSIPRALKVKRASLSRATRQSVLRKTAGKCVYCGTLILTDPNSPNRFVADHVLAHAKGGSDDIANFVLSCWSCNSAKRAKTALQFMGKDGDDDAP